MLAQTWLPAMHLVKELLYVRRQASTAVRLEIVLRVIVAQYQCMQKNDLTKLVTMLAQIWPPAMQLVKEILLVLRWGGTRVPLEIVQVTIVARCRLLKTSWTVSTSLVGMLAQTWLPAMHLVKEILYVRRRASMVVRLETVLRTIVAQHKRIKLVLTNLAGMLVRTLPPEIHLVWGTWYAHEKDLVGASLAIVLSIAAQ